MKELQSTSPTEARFELIAFVKKICKVTGHHKPFGMIVEADYAKSH